MVLNSYNLWAILSNPSWVYLLHTMGGYPVTRCPGTAPCQTSDGFTSLWWSKSVHSHRLQHLLSMMVLTIAGGRSLPGVCEYPMAGRTSVYLSATSPQSSSAEEREDRVFVSYPSRPRLASWYAEMNRMCLVQPWTVSQVIGAQSQTCRWSNGGWWLVAGGCSSAR